MSLTCWFLVSSSGCRHRLPREMIFVGREDCELMLQSRSVDKQHAVINYNPTTDEHLVKDLGSLNGTFVNDLRIPDQTYITLKLSDILRFGYDSHVYILEKSQHKVPEEALKHEKYSSQLQVSLRTDENRTKHQETQNQNQGPGATDASVRPSDIPVSRPTPLYGQPSWWGDEDYGSNEEHGFFDVPTKDLHHGRTAAMDDLHEIPTKDTDPPPSPPTVTPPVVQSHASFTIEFDDCTPGKIKIKDHITKFSTRQRKAPPTKASQPAAPTEVMSAQSKVCDWLVHSDVSRVRKQPQCDDVYSTKSDLAMNIKTLKGHHHEDGTQSDSEDPVLPDRTESPPSVQSGEAPQIQTVLLVQEQAALPPQPQSEHLTQQAFIIEFLDDNPRKRRSQSFTHSPAQADSNPVLKAKLERRKGGERPASVHGNVSPTQHVSVPLNVQQRSSSLKRDRMDGETSAVVRPFGSVGRKSRLTQEFDFLQDVTQRDPVSPPPHSAPPVMALPPKMRTPLPREPAALQSSTTFPTNTASPHRTPVLSMVSSAGFHDDHRGRGRTEEDDSLSDAGTYTIETEAPDQEVEQARSMIDQVFGILDPPENRPIIVDGNDELLDPLQGLISVALCDPVQVPAGFEGPKWVSRWASLADNYPEPCPTLSHGDREEDFGLQTRSTGSCSYDNAESETSFSSRPRRLLPQVPPDQMESFVPGILIRHKSYQIQDTLTRDPGPLHSRESSQHLSVQDDVDPDSLSDASRSDDLPTLEIKPGIISPGAQCHLNKKNEKMSPTTKFTSFYIGSDDSAQSPGQSEKVGDLSPKPPPTTILIRHLSGNEPRGTGIKTNNSAPNLRTPDKEAVPTKESVVSAIIRQESFTKDRPNDTVQMKKLPHISSHPSIRDLEQSRDTFQYQESIFDEKFPFSVSKKGSSPDHNSLSESDVDTASTVSQVSSKNTPVSSTSKKRPAVRNQKDRSSSSVSNQENRQQLSARERLSEKRRIQKVADAPNKTEAAKRLQMRRSTGKRGSLDLSVGQQLSSPHEVEAMSSDHDVTLSSSHSKKVVVLLQKEEMVKTQKMTTQQVLTRSNSLSAPRPTRASMLRRARLGEASDNEGTETDRGSQNSDHITAPSRVSAEGKKLSRLDILAMPRKRTGSFTASGDIEVASAGRTSLSTRNLNSSVASRKTSGNDGRQGNKVGNEASGKQRLTRTRSSGAKYPGSGHRHKGSGLSSSSEEEYQAGVGASKTKSFSCPSDATVTHCRSKSKSLQTEEDVGPSDVDPYQNWSTHSAEIAKLSQDLAKDLAILAQEINDVAGDGDSQSSSSQAITPAATISAQEEKLPPGSAPSLDSNIKALEMQPPLRNHEEVMVDNLMLNPVSQLSQVIRENTEQLAQKMKVLFQNKACVWEEIEAQMIADNEAPLLKTSNQEISNILRELQKVQRQLEVINTIVEPAQATPPSSALPIGQTRPSQREKKSSNKSRGHASIRRPEP
ncbi:centrosomal protein of 170 kDa protein B isoform X2 [Gouania willdenowi]|uniref:centrosomal protein of 170 kDa protein B isoform X2 n=1 Tax=Gouania willdenowi TaxID=441366 RepID=UPI0010553560|nr:centrosomal protein of 170 kDa protein B-like isoform X2 [Gouania willdenowi]